MKSLKRISILPLVGLMAVTGSISAAATTAAPGPKIVSELSVDKPGKTAPGEVLTYTLAFVNRGTGPARSLVAVDPIPHGTEYIPGSAATPLARTEFSIDGGKTWAELPLQVSTDIGKKWAPAAAADYSTLLPAREKDLSSGIIVHQGGRDFKAAGPSQYTHARWIFKKALSPGDRALFSIQVRVR